MFIFNIEKAMFGDTADSFVGAHNPIRSPLQEVYVRNLEALLKRQVSPVIKDVMEMKPQQLSI